MIKEIISSELFQIEVKVVESEEGFAIVIEGFPNTNAALSFSGWIRDHLDSEDSAGITSEQIH